jgi:hypothetical protein
MFYMPPSIYSVLKGIQQLNLEREAQAISQLQSTGVTLEKFLAERTLLESCSFLKAQQSAGLIAAYTVRSEQATCNFPEGMETLPPQEAGTIRDFNVRSLSLKFLKKQTANVQWAVAVLKPVNLTLWTYLKEHAVVRQAFVSDFVLVLYTICVLVCLAVLILAKSIQNDYRSRGQDARWLQFLNAWFGWLQLHDLEILKRATIASSAYTEDLKKNLDLLETSLTDSILNEIRQSHEKIPYTFHGTVAKVDINGFSKAVREGNAQNAFELTNSLEEFGCELLMRYQGLFDKTVGDEIVAVFKDSDGPLLASAFCRDLMKEFSRIDFAVGAESRRFTLKSAISESDITFRKRRSGYGFDGRALVYATRLMDAVSVKDRNVLCSAAQMSDQILPLVRKPQEARLLEFKNLPSETGYFHDQFIQISDIFEQQPNFLKYFRSDSDIIFLFEQLKAAEKIETIQLVTAHLKSINVRNCASEIIEKWKEIVGKYAIKSAADSRQRTTLSNIIKLAENLIPGHKWDDACIQTLLGVPKDLEDRINSSVIEVLTQKGVPENIFASEKEFVNMASPQNYRSKGNVLLARALNQLDAASIANLNDMLSSENKFERHTGVYCACEVILFYRHHNPAELETYAGYKTMTDKLRKIRTTDGTLSPRLHGFLDRI